MTTLELLNQWALSIVAVVWFFALGASMGSFLNVLVYRLPRGLPIAWSGSRCPKCANPIALTDNIPLLGWLRLRGKCRSCGLPISGRYPLVEAAVGGMMLLLLFVEVFSGGANLPVRAPNRWSGPAHTLLDPQWDLLALFCYHAALGYLLLGMSLVELDRRRIPRSLWLAGLLIGVSLPLAMPVLHVVSWRGHDAPAPQYQPEPPWIEQVGLEYSTLLIGLLAGTALGLLLATWESTRPGRTVCRAGLAMVGLYLGWHAALTVASFVSLANLPRWGLGLACGRTWPVGFCVFTAALAHIVVWRWIAACPYLPGPYAAWWTACYWLALCGTMTAAVRSVARRPP